MVIHCLNALFFFILCSRRECGAPNGSTAFRLSAFVLEGFLTSQLKKTTKKTHRRFFLLGVKYVQATALSNGSQHVHLPDEASAACLIIQRKRGMKRENLKLLSFQCL